MARVVGAEMEHGSTAAGGGERRDQDNNTGPAAEHRPRLRQVGEGEEVLRRAIIARADDDGEDDFEDLERREKAGDAELEEDAPNMGRCGEMWGDVRRYGEIWGEMGRCRAREGRTTCTGPRRPRRRWGRRVHRGLKWKGRR